MILGHTYVGLLIYLLYFRLALFALLVVGATAAPQYLQYPGYQYPLYPQYQHQYFVPQPQLRYVLFLIFRDSFRLKQRFFCLIVLFPMFDYSYYHIAYLDKVNNGILV